VRDSMRRTRTKLHHVAKHLVCYVHPCNYILSCTKTSHNTIIYHLQCVPYLVRIIILLLYRARPRRGARSSAASRFPCSRGDGTRYTICFGKKTQFFFFFIRNGRNDTRAPDSLGHTITHDNNIIWVIHYCSMLQYIVRPASAFTTTDL